MSAVETIRALAAGERPVTGLLHSCRFEGFGAEGYGEETIVERFRAADCNLPDDAFVFECDRHVAIFAEDRAMFADVAEGGIARLWALSDDVVATPEPGASVVFDPDLMQARGDLFFAASDHPALDESGAATLVKIGQGLARDDCGYRARAFAIRAFGTAERGAALFAIYRLDGAGELASGFACAAVCWGEGEALIVHDRAGAATVTDAPWTPRIGA